MVGVEVFFCVLGLVEIYWCVGKGVILILWELLFVEVVLFGVFFDVLVCLLLVIVDCLVLFFVLLVGGVYGGVVELLYCEFIFFVLVFVYGDVKFVMEMLVVECGVEQGWCIVIGRFINFYGFGQDLMKKQGLILMFVDSVIMMQFVIIYVFLDMLCDYIFEDDVVVVVSVVVFCVCLFFVGVMVVKIVGIGCVVLVGVILGELR